MKVPRKACSGRLTLVQADVVPLRTEHPVEHGDHLLNGLEWLEQVGSGELAQGSVMDKGGDQQMSIIIGISVQEDHRPWSTPYDHVLAVSVLEKPSAEEAGRITAVAFAWGFSFGTRGVEDVRGAPGGPEPIHTHHLAIKSNHRDPDGPGSASILVPERAEDPGREPGKTQRNVSRENRAAVVRQVHHNKQASACLGGIPISDRGVRGVGPVGFPG